MAAPIIDAATFAELQASAGEDFVGELIDTFFEEAPTMLAELRRSAAAAEALDRRLPPRLQTFVTFYDGWIDQLRNAPPTVSTRRAGSAPSGRRTRACASSP